MQLYNPNDLNDPNNPFGKSYRPKYVMEFHVKQGSKPPIPRDQLLGYPECAVNIALKQPYPTTIGIVSSTLTVSFTGRIKSTAPVFRKKFEADKQKIQDRLVAEACNWLASFQFSPNINLNDWAKSSATVTSPSTGAYPSTTTTVSQDAVSSTVTAGSSSTAVGLDQNGPNISASDNIGDDDVRAGMSAAQPLTLIFTFAPKSIDIKVKPTILLKGEAEFELEVTVMPILPVVASDGAVALQSSTMRRSFDHYFINTAERFERNSNGGAGLGAAAIVLAVAVLRREVLMEAVTATGDVILTALIAWLVP